MKLSEYKKEYQDFSRLASERSRVAAFAGIAIVWLFREIDNSGKIHLSDEMLLPLLMFVWAILLEFFQYLLGAFIWFCVFKYFENSLADKTKDPDFVHKSILALPIHALFYLKFVLVAFGYILLVKHIATWF